MLAELVLRNETPLELRISLLFLLLILALFYALIPSWLPAQYSLATLPFQKFDWMSQEHSKNNLLRASSIVCISIVFSIFAFSYLSSNAIQFASIDSVNFLLILVIVIGLTTAKLFLNRSFFALHNQSSLGEVIIDYQYSLNVLFSIVISLLMVYDVFYLRMNTTMFYVTAGLIVALFLVKLFGTILLLQNKYSYPLITVFIYLCTAEIVPALIVAKVLFVNS